MTSEASLGYPSVMRLGVTFLCMFMALVGLGGCDVFSGRHYRITVTVDVKGTLISGSSVQEFRCHEQVNGLDTSRCMIRGEAVVVDLKERGYLFLILRGKHSAATAMVGAILSARSRDLLDAPTPKLPVKWALREEEMPMMVTFKDLSNSKTVNEVNGEYLGGAFGSDVRLVSVWVEETRDPITWGQVEKVLPWIKTLGNKGFDGQRLITPGSKSLANRLDSSHFIRRQ